MFHPWPVFQATAPSQGDITARKLERNRSAAEGTGIEDEPD
jgi:hypothetical protein